MKLEIRLLGSFVVRVPGRIPVHFATRKEQELLAYLFLHRGRPLARETLASLLWGETTTAQSKTYLRKALWRVRSTLEKAGAPEIGDAFQSDTDWLQMDLPEGLWVDVVAFEEALSQAQHDRVEAAARRAALEKATAYYMGELLEGWYFEWCLYERERLRLRFVEALHHLIQVCEATGEFACAVAHGLQLVQQTPYSERAHRVLMRARYRAGDRWGALQQYDQCKRMLREELNIDPMAETEALYAQIQAGAPLEALVLPAPEHTRPPEDQDHNGHVPLYEMKRLEQSLRLLHEELWLEVRRLEQHEWTRSPEPRSGTS